MKVKKIATTVVLVILVLGLFKACDMTYIDKNDDDSIKLSGDQPYIPSDSVDFLSFVCERDEAYYFKPENHIFFNANTGTGGIVEDIPVFENDYPSDYYCNTIFTSIGFEFYITTRITNIDYFRQFDYYFPEINPYHSSSLSLPEIGDFSLNYAPRKTETFTVPFQFIFNGLEGLSFSDTFTVTDTFKTVSRDFYRYKKLIITYPDTVTVERVLGYPIFKSYSYSNNTLTIELNEYTKPLQDYVCMLFLRAEDGSLHRRYITIGL